MATNIRWTDEELKYLAELYPDHTYDEIRDLVNEKFHGGKKVRTSRQSITCAINKAYRKEIL